MQSRIYANNNIKCKERCRIPTNATPLRGNATPYLQEKHYFCAMKNLIGTIALAQEPCLIVGVGVILISILLAYVSLREYRMYLDENYKARFSLADFIKQEQLYLFLWLLILLIAAVALVFWE